MNETAQISVLRRLVQWLVLLACLGVALLYLHSALHALGVSGGPSSPASPGGYLPVAEPLCLALAAISFGVGLFRGIRTFPVATGRSAAFIVLGALLALGPYIGRFVLIDACLDRGAGWNRATQQCSDE